MQSEGLRADIRRLLLRGNVFGLAVAVVIGTALYHFFYTTLEYLALPLMRALVSSGGSDDLVADPLRIEFNGYALIFEYAVVLIAIMAAASMLAMFVSRRYSEDMAFEDEEDAEDSDMRSCPECLSDIPRLARRCAYCTAPVEPTEAIS